MIRRLRRPWLPALAVGLVAAAAALVMIGVADAATQRHPGVVYRSAQDGLLWEISDGTPVMVANGLGMAPGTQPAVAALSGGGRVIAFHAFGSDNLWYVDANNVGHDTGHRMPSGSSPAIVALPGDNFRIAFNNADDGLLWEVSTDGSVFHAANGLGVAPWSSPAIGWGGSGVGLITVFADPAGVLSYVDATDTYHATTSKVAKNTSPIVATWMNGYRIAFVNEADGLLWERSSNGSLFFAGNGLGVAAGTSPAMASGPTGGLMLAFQANGSGNLWYVDFDNNGHDTGRRVAAGTSPSVVVTNVNSYNVAFQTERHTLAMLWGGGGTMFDTHLLMSPGTSPDVDKPMDATTWPSTPAIAAATLDAPKVAGTSVTLTWTDKAVNDASYRLLRRDPTKTGDLPQVINERAATDRGGVGKVYTHVDTVPAGARRCYTVEDSPEPGISNYSNEVCTGTLALPNPPAAGPGLLSVPDQNGLTGVRGAMTIGSDGLGIVSYAVGGTCTACPLRVAHCSNVTCSAVSTHDIGPAGFYSAIRIGSDGLPLISYVLSDTNRLRVAHCVDVVCSSATIASPDPAAYINNETAMTIGADGLATIVYQNASGSSVNPTTPTNVVHCLNVACTSASIRTIDAAFYGGDGGAVGTVAVAASPTGATYVAYTDGGFDSDLKVTTCLDPACAAIAAQVSVDVQAHAGYSPSVAIGLDGLPVISYLGNGVGAASDLVVGHCVNVYCTAVTRAAVHTGAGLGWFTRIAIGADGLGVVAFTDHTNMNLEVAHCADVVCSGLTHSVVDEFDEQGWGNTLTIGTDGLPLIGYHDLTDGLLKIVHCADVTCAGPIVAPF